MREKKRFTGRKRMVNEKRRLKGEIEWEGGKKVGQTGGQTDIRMDHQTSLSKLHKDGFKWCATLPKNRQKMCVLNRRNGQTDSWTEQGRDGWMDGPS